MTQGVPSDTDDPLDEFEVANRQDSKKRLRTTLIVTTILLVFVAAYIAAQAAFAQKVPSGTTISGVDVGGLTSAEAQERLAASLQDRAEAPVVLTVGDKSVDLLPSLAGLRLDVKGTTDGLTGFSLNPARLIQHLGGGATMEVQTDIDTRTLERAIAKVAPDLAVDPIDGTLTIVDGSPIATDPVDGVAVDAEATAREVAATWMRSDEPPTVAVTAVSPAITQSVLDEAAAQAQTIVSAPVWVEVDDQRAELPESVVAAALSYHNEDGVLVPTLDADDIRTAVIDRTTKLERKPTNARFAFSKKNRPVIRGGAAGTTLDGDAVATAVLAAAQTSDRTASVALTESEPKVTKADLEALGVKEVVSEFSTVLTPDSVRTANLARAGELLTGTLVKPGETFGLTDTIGPITAENGYREAGVVVNGFHTTGIGGGLSQVATTTYNVGFFAGMVDVEHRPHTQYFSRYPEGRESTLAVGSLDMKFRNDSPYGLLLRAWVADGYFHAQAWSTTFYDVESSTSPRSGVQSPTRVYSSATGCTPNSAGQPGFTVTVRRKVTEIESGEVPIDEANTWTYRPTNQIICGSPPKKDSSEDD